jgi:short-subunit dehydrogenase involved in D-alanine esterification of teichoic acids
MRLQGNKIMVTCATSRIGEALAKIFVGLNNEVISIGRSVKKLEKLAKLDERIIPFNCDITRIENLDKSALFIENKHSVF